MGLLCDFQDFNMVLRFHWDFKTSIGFFDFKVSRDMKISMGFQMRFCILKYQWFPPGRITNRDLFKSSGSK